MRLFNTAALLLCIAAPAGANGWQWSTWGMTPTEVAAAAPVKTAPYADAKIDTPALEAEMVTTHHTMGFDFSVAMLFDRHSHGLGQVRMLLADADGTKCSALQGELRKVYGPPEGAAPMGYRRWRDDAGGNLISVQPFGGCWLVYEPIPTKEGSGL